MQGDILRVTPALEKTIKEIHPKYLISNNIFFLVLTQSCDLVRRSETPFGVSYITLAAVRPLSLLVGRKIDGLKETDLNIDEPVCTQRAYNSLILFMRRLFNNNEPEYFYLRKEPSKGIPEDSCAFLRLSVPIKADLHYQICLDSRLLCLTDVFRAKLGWLVGQIYSRVGTEDWKEDELTSEVQKSLTTRAIKVEEKQLKALKEKTKLWQSQNPGQKLDRIALGKMINELSRIKKSETIGRTVEVVKKTIDNYSGEKHIPLELLESIKRELERDPSLTALLK
jgi:hypothetical protein